MSTDRGVWWTDTAGISPALSLPYDEVLFCKLTVSVNRELPTRCRHISPNRTGEHFLQRSGRGSSGERSREAAAFGCRLRNCRTGGFSELPVEDKLY